MGLLKTYLVREELQVSHAERYLTYKDRFHAEVYLDLQNLLEEKWEKVVDKFNKTYQTSEQTRQEELFNNHKALLNFVLVKQPEKLITSRAHTPIEVYPSVKIPYVFKKEMRDLCIKSLLEEAQRALEELTNKWSEIFEFEKRGKLSPWFKVAVEHDEIRLQLAASQGDEHTYRTLYSIRIEHGRSGSKTKSFDRVYLTSSL